ncbi:MAG: FAD-binding protein [Myxococcales bacterium]|nr:FAD-binding protein [Myxococcales bacterium]
MAETSELVARLRQALPAHAVIDDPVARRAWDTDGLTMHRALPLVVTLPGSTAEVVAVMRICHELGVPIVPRGAGTGLSGGALPHEQGVTVALSRMNRILEVDLDNRCVVAQPGVTNLSVTEAVAAQGYYYAPDPSSQVVCSLGGNVAENSGGVHCLKYGLTTHNLLGVQLVTVDGEVLRLGGKHLDAAGYDLLGIVTGSEGLLGIVTEVTVRILKTPAVARALLLGFASEEDAGACVAEVIGAGIVPAGMEMMDRLAIQAVEAFCAPGYPADAAAVLIVELDGPQVEVDELVAQVQAIAEGCGATSARASADEAERHRFWQGRKAAFPAMSRIQPDYYCMDGTIPRHQLPAVLERIRSLSAEHGLQVANVFHAGDGNLHPLVLYDAQDPAQIERAEALGADILRACVAAGGVLSGEHGIGVEKRALMSEVMGETDLRVMQRLKCAFDPEGLLNPGKVFPTLHRCAEGGRMHVHHGDPRHASIPRF